MVADRPAICAELTPATALVEKALMSAALSASKSFADMLAIWASVKPPAAVLVRAAIWLVESVAISELVSAATSPR